MSRVNIVSVGQKFRVTIDGKPVDDVGDFEIRGTKGGKAVVSLWFLADVVVEADAEVDAERPPAIERSPELADIVGAIETATLKPELRGDL